MKALHILASMLFLHFTPAISQPYVDPFQIRYTYALKDGGTSMGTPFQHFWAGSDLPLKLKDKNYLVLSPFFEQWKIDSAQTKNVLPSVKSFAFPISLLFPLKNKRWSVGLTPIIRWNGAESFGSSTFQYGGVGFMNYEIKPAKKIRFGAYVNKDFFGIFYMPLFGLDWKLNDRNYVFGMLPGRLTWEHKLHEQFYWGATFRAITNSFRLINGQFVRIDDNQLSLFADAYIGRHVCLTLEPGHGIMRKLRTGTNSKNYLTNENWGDGFFIKLSAAYRVRL